ncbi:MAG: hypothetical protein M1812_007879 [Candelaria pacifica]|nr:MAG: hypothetical protein M1812_007879 [Candelaria pacifica]
MNKSPNPHKAAARYRIHGHVSLVAAAKLHAISNDRASLAPKPGSIASSLPRDRLEGVVERAGVRVWENEAMTRFGGSQNTTRNASHKESDEWGGPLHGGKETFLLRAADVDSKGPDKELGRLAVEEGKSRYVSNSFWASLSGEVAHIRDFLNDPFNDGDNDHTPPESDSGSHSNQHGFIFAFSSSAANLRTLHPPVDQIVAFWHLYTENVDPLTKILHRPTMQKMVNQVKSNLNDIGNGNEALLFAMYFSVITSLPPNECRNILEEEKGALLSRYRFGAEQALARASVLTTQELVTLQAFVIFLISVRRHGDTHLVWTLCGLAIRIAQSLGLHRDGSAFGLSPYETEMRRRTWWSICILDVQISEDHGSDPTIIEQSFDTKLPLNVNDDQLDSKTEEAPLEHQGYTEMTFCLIRYEVSNTMRQLNYVPPGPGYNYGIRSAVPLTEKERWIEECHERLEEKYLRYCDMTVPLNRVTATVARLIMAKMWLIVYHPFQHQDGGVSPSQETKDRLFTASVEVIEYSKLLETENATAKWGWLFSSYVQWHAVAFVLSELCVRTMGLEVERAWQMIEIVFRNWAGDTADAKNGVFWRLMRKLYVKAKAARDRDFNRKPATPSTATPSSATTNPSSVDAFGQLPLPGTTMNSLSLASGPAKEISYSESILRNKPQTSHSTISHWLVNDATSMPGPGDYTVNWSRWDDMVNGFEMESDYRQGIESGPVLGDVGSWR